ncbi:TetR/AcrR family transcriptional regulator [Pediococcus stilesii]|uniref:TetR/AcrR family transcriptional regulator n=1 Tax=Pediococcus stilesii TaxID=331679 RepID=A0A5R9BVV3_9LACO|nr:TetR/AcrR family transcriptional regulator [Pediococcus stilesii]TLQ04804.1 TetR/AcrR family transcriptional regulator [Pediococcus stilesii]
MNKIVKDPQKVERILGASLNHFANQRYQRTKVDEIASDANVSKGIVFRYFKNKANLYLETLKYALENFNGKIDYSIWLDAKDMSEMIVQATTYKIKLQQKYPKEFRLLLDAYANANDFSDEFNAQVQKVYAENSQAPTELILPVLKRMNLREDVQIDDALRMINGVILQITEESKIFVHEHPDGDLKDMTEIIAHAKTYMDIFERGIQK